MTDTEILAGLLSLDDNHPYARAVIAALDRCRDEEMVSVTTPDLSDGARHYNAGALARSINTIEYFKKVRRDAQENFAAEEKRRQQKQDNT